MKKAFCGCVFSSEYFIAPVGKLLLVSSELHFVAFHVGMFLAIQRDSVSRAIPSFFAVSVSVAPWDAIVIIVVIRSAFFKPFMSVV